MSPVELTGERGARGRGRGAESYDRKKAWTSINGSILPESNAKIDFYITLAKMHKISARAKIAQDFGSPAIAKNVLAITDISAQILEYFIFALHF